MADAAILSLDIGPFWRYLNDQLLRIVDLFPDNKLNWTPDPELWNARGILIHVSGARDHWLERTDGEGITEIWQATRTKDDLKRELERTFERLMRLLTNRERMDAEYADSGDASRRVSGHWLAFQLLEHDIHHRAELVQRLALLGIKHDIQL